MDFPSGSSRPAATAPGDRRPLPDAPPAFVVRVAGLPVQVLHDLHFERSARLVDEVLARGDRVLSEGRELADRLYTVIGGVDHKPTRYRLLALRRDLHRGRRPKPAHVDAEVRDALPADLDRALARWLSDLEDWAATEARLAEEVTRESARKRLCLRRAAADPAFRNGLVSASPDFRAELGKWLAAGPAPNPRVEGTLVKYLARAAVKTSPFSTLTSTGEGGWSDRADVAHRAGWTRRSVVELNLLLTRAIAEAVGRWPEVRPSLVVRVNASLVEDAAGARFLVRGRDERVVAMRPSPTLRRVLDSFSPGRWYPYDEAVGALRERFAEGTVADVTGLLERLADLGLLEVRLPVADQSGDPLRDLADVLRRHGGQRPADLRRSLAQLRGLLADYARHDTPEARASCADDLDAVARAVATDLRLPTDLVPRKNLFYEDTVLDLDLRLPREHWHVLRPDIGLLHELAGLYDMALPTRLTATAFFAARYGSGGRTDVLTFFRDFAAERPGPPAGLAEVNRLQRRLAADVARCPVGPDGVRHLDPALVLAAAARIGDLAGPARLLTLHCQLVHRAGVPGIVLNDLYRGVSRSLARQVRLRGGEPPRDHAEPDGPLLADVVGATGTNLELRAPLTHHEITCPGGIGERPPAHRIPLGELDVAHDPADGRLRLLRRRDGREVTPQHLGTTALFLLPPVHRFLLEVFGEASYVYLRQGLSGLVWRARTGEVEHVPRLCLGHVVVNRAKWVAAAESVPRRTGDVAAHLVETTRWRRAHGIPERCFVRAVDPAARTRSAIAGKSRKPLYMDFGSPFFAEVLDEVLARRGRLVVFEEVLPDRGDLVVSAGTASYAAEIVLHSTLRGDRRG
ncbi:hypothetical protein SUDANB95_01961 [Actinosynnema sp. ALI-1.44]